jgi:hypothetical protein
MKEEFRHNVRGINEFNKYGGEFYKEIVEKNGGFANFLTEAYEGFEHKPVDLKEKVPNKTIMWNLPFNENGFMYASSLGHFHEEKGREVQEVYEFLNYGGMLISTEDKVDLIVCKPRDKVIVPSECMMTILNFSVGELETLDMANPYKNKSSKEILINNLGPQVALYNTGENGETYMGKKCSTLMSNRFGRKVVLPYSGKIKFKINSNYKVFGIEEDKEINLTLRNNNCDLAKEILEQKEVFSKYNINVKKGECCLSYVDNENEMHVLGIGLEKLVGNSTESLEKMLGFSHE